MSYVVLARKYRPQTFSEVVGQEHVTRTLKNAIAAVNFGQPVIFRAPRSEMSVALGQLAAEMKVTPAPEARKAD